MTVVYPNSRDKVNLRSPGLVRLRCKQSGDGGIPIFMVHGDEANILIPKYLPDYIPFYAFHHMGANGRKIPFFNIEDTAALYLEVLRSIQPVGPYFLSGYSIGGLIAYEMAQMILEEGETVESLILLDTKSPTLKSDREYHNRQFRWDQSRTYKFFNKAYKKCIVAACSITGNTIPRKHIPFHLMERYRKARKQYRPKDLPGNIILIRSSKDNFRDPYLGWQKHIKGDIEIFDIHTDHHHITIEPAIRDVAEVYAAEYQA